MKIRLGRGAEIRRCEYTNYCEGLDANHKQVTCKLWDREGLTEPDVRLASDIHLEPDERGLAVRYRIDGVLRQVLDLPRAAGVPLVSRVKIISGLDIADRLRPQDGRARVVVNGKAVDLRISTLPAAHGEKVVIRFGQLAREMRALAESAAVA